MDEEDRVIGTVKAIHNYGAGDVIEIARADGDTVLLPFARDFVPVVDVANGAHRDRGAGRDRSRRERKGRMSDAHIPHRGAGRSPRDGRAARRRRARREPREAGRRARAWPRNMRAPSPRWSASITTTCCSPRARAKSWAACSSSSCRACRARAPSARSSNPCASPPTRAGKTVGTALMKEAIRLAREGGCGLVQLDFRHAPHPRASLLPPPRLRAEPFRVQEAA